MTTTTSDQTSRTAAFVELITPQTAGGAGTFTTKPGGGMPAGRMHGGIVMAQCLMAAGASGELNIAHSVHAQFLRPGDSTQPLKITVRALRTGKNFATSHVTAGQGEIVVMEAVVSFTGPREGIVHSFVARPLTPRPEEFEEQDWSWMAWQANEARAPRFPVAANGDDPTLAMWFRPISPLPDDPIVHAAAILYQTDMPTAKYLTDYHGLAVGTQASLDHALWFHGEPHWEGWNLWSLVSPIANNSRALINGQMFASDGRLIASVAQEALYRV